MKHHFCAYIHDVMRKVRYQGRLRQFVVVLFAPLILTHAQTHIHRHAHPHPHTTIPAPIVSLVCNELCMANNSTGTLHSRSHLKFTVHTVSQWETHTYPKHNQLWCCSDECCISTTNNTHTQKKRERERTHYPSFKFHSQTLMDY